MKKIILYLILVFVLVNCKSKANLINRDSYIVYKSYNFKQGQGVIELEDGAIIHIPHRYYFRLKNEMPVRYIIENNKIVKIITNDFTYTIK